MDNLNYSLIEKLKEIHKLKDTAKNQEALISIEKIIDSRSLNIDEQLDALLLKGEILYNIGNFEELLSLSKDISQEAEKSEKFLQNIDALILMVNALWRLSRLSESEQIILKGENLINSSTNISTIELEKRRAILFSRKANIYGGRGDVDKALIFLEQGLLLSSKYGFKKEQAMCLNNIGHITYNKGELAKALSYHEQSLAIREKLGITQDLSLSIGNIGIVYYDMGQFDKALTYFEKSLSLNLEIGNPIHLSDIYYFLIRLLVDLNQLDTAQNYLKEFQNLIEKTHIKLVQHRYLISKALFLRKDPKLIKKVEAENIFRQIVNEKIFEHQLTVIAYFNLFEMLIEELQTTEREELLNEVKMLAEQLLTIINTVNSYSYLVEIHILQSKLALVELKVEESKQLLTMAQLIAQERGLRGLLIKATKELDLLVNQENQWKKFQKNSTPLHERIELAHLMDLVRRMVYKKMTEILESEEENPVFPNINLNLNEVQNYLKLLSESSELKQLMQKINFKKKEI